MNQLLNGQVGVCRNRAGSNCIHSHAIRGSSVGFRRGSLLTRVGRAGSCLNDDRVNLTTKGHRLHLGISVARICELHTKFVLTVERQRIRPVVVNQDSDAGVIRIVQDGWAVANGLFGYADRAETVVHVAFDVLRTNGDGGLQTRSRLLVFDLEIGLISVPKCCINSTHTIRKLSSSLAGGVLIGGLVLVGAEPAKTLATRPTLAGSQTRTTNNLVR